MKYKGQNLVEILILMAVVIVGAIVILTLLGNNVGNMYSLAVDKVVNFSPFGKQQIATTPGPLGGTSDNPVKQCNSGTCDIDYGEFMLTGVPDNFGEFVQSSGSSGGTDSLSSLIEQIADQLEEKGDTEQAKELKDIANLGHFFSNMQEEIETLAKTCNAEADTAICFKNKITSDNGTFSPPSNLSTILPNFDQSYQKLSYLGINGMGVGGTTILGVGKYFKNTDDASSSDSFDVLKLGHPAYAMVDKFDTFINNPGYSDNLKNIVKELYINLDNVAMNQAGTISTICNAATTATFDRYDLITGEPIEPITFDASSGLLNIINPSSSNFSDLDSALICVAGKNKDTNSDCHQ